MRDLANVVLIVLALGVPSFGQTTFDERKAWLLARDWSVATVNGEPGYGGPKSGMPYALVHLHLSGGEDAHARQYASQVLLDYQVDNFFEPIGVVRAVYMFWDHFTPAQREAIRHGAQLRRNWVRASGTGNQRLMFLTNGYLLAQRFDKGSWHANSQNPAVDGAQLRTMIKDALLEEGRARFAVGLDEFLSPNYLIYHIIPLINLWEFSGDEDLEDAAEALLAFHLAHLALNVHDGYVLEPHARVKGPQYTGTPTSSNQTVLLNWLYWGQTDPTNTSVRALRPLAYLALSDFRPWPLLERIAGGPGNGGQTTRSTVPNVVDGSVAPAAGVTKRSVYRTPLYAVGAGGFKHVPDGHYLDRSHFGISWTSDDPLGFLQVGHPYWYADGLQWAALDQADSEDERPWWDAPASPFEQTVHHESTAIVLLQIPDDDPWAGRGRSDWWAYRDEQAARLRKQCTVRFPETIDERRQHDVAGQPGVRWYFLREGNVHVGIRALTAAYSWVLNPEVPEAERLRLIQSHGSRCGFVFEIGTAADFPSSPDAFADFRAALVANDEAGGSVVFDAAAVDFAARYMNLAGDVLRLEYVASNDPSDPINATNTFPRAFVNDVAVDFDAWPLIDTPGYDGADPDDVFVRMTGSVLEVVQGGESFVVDWSTALPTLTLQGAGAAAR